LPSSAIHWCKSSSRGTRHSWKPRFGVYSVPWKSWTTQFSLGLVQTKTKNKNIKSPFLNLAQPIQSNPELWILKNGVVAPGIKFFLRGCHFHQPSRIFHGTIPWPDRLNGSHQWDLVLGFQEDYRFLSTGRIHKRRDLQKTDNELPKDYTSEQKKLCRYPFDG
jgi:hypothetical protein